MNRHLKSGDLLIDPRQADGGWRVLSAEPVDGHIRLFNRAEHTERYWSVEDIFSKVQKGEWRHQRDSDPAVSAVAQRDPNYTEDLKFALGCLREVENAMRQLECSFHKAYQLVLHEHRTSVAASRKPFPSQATLYRYRDAQLQERLPLVGDKNKGRRQPRYVEAVDSFIYDLAKSHYLRQGARWTLNHLHELANDRLRDAGLVQASQCVSKKHLKKVIRTRLTVDPDADRMDPKKVAGARSIGGKRITVFHPFERVEQDALHLPFVIRTPHGLSSNVWVVHAIDCATSMPVGWQFVVGSPSESDGLQCVYSVLTSKVGPMQALGLECKLDVHGAPSLLAFDNGPETKGERMQRLALLGIDLEHGKSRHPQRRPFIERLNRSLKEALETLPGCTRFNGKDGMRDPVALGDQLMELAELQRWVVRWYYESWMHNILERLARTQAWEDVKLGTTPAKRWKAMSEQLGFVMPLPVSEEEWRSLMYRRTTRKLSRKTGITYEGLNYKGEALAGLIHRLGEAEVTALVDPEDYRFIYVVEDESKPMVRLHEEFVGEFSPAYTLQQFKQKLAEEKDISEEHPDAVQFRRDTQAASVVSQKTRPTRKSTQVNQETTRKTKESKARQQAIDKPFVPAAATASVAQDGDWGFDAVEALPVLDRRDGKVRP